MNEIAASTEFELIAQAMLQSRGDLAKASRLDTVNHNAMSLRAVVKGNPEIRARYHELLAEEMQEKGLHIAERIRKMAELQDQAYGQIIKDSEGNELEIPADPNTVVKLSVEISRLIAEGKTSTMSVKNTLIIASAQDAKELLESFLKS